MVIISGVPIFRIFTVHIYTTVALMFAIITGIWRFWGLSTVASHMVRNRIFYIKIRSIEKDGNTPTAHCGYPLAYFGFAKYSKCKYQRE